METYALPTDTAHVKIEGRQYSLFNFDLGEGIVRERMMLGSMVVGVYIAVMVVLGVDFLSQTGPAIYLSPPLLFTWAALRTDHGGRPAYALWLDRGRYLARRHRPIVPITGTRPLHAALARLEPVIRPTRQPGAARPFTATAEFVVLNTERL